MPNPFGVSLVHRAAREGPWLCFFGPAHGWVNAADLVAQMQRRVEEAGGLPADVTQIWYSTRAERAAPGEVHLKDVGEKVGPWLPVAPENFPCGDAPAE